MGVFERLIFLLASAFTSFLDVAGDVLLRWGWIVLVIVFFMGVLRVYMLSIQQKYIDSMQWVNLRMRVPEDNTRTPRSMEEVFNALHGMHKPADLFDKYLDGYVQSWLSLEIRGTADNVSYIIRAPEGNRDLVESAIYAQYPDAEIEEVADYISPFTLEHLEEEFDIWGTSFELDKEDAYPIKTYIDFEDQFAEDDNLIDPAATISELSSNLKPGEEIWLQVVARPVITNEWREEGMRLALKLAGREVPEKRSLIDKAFKNMGKAISYVTAPAGEESKNDSEMDLGALRLTPGETEIVRAIQRNVSKVAFETQVRALYIAPKTVFNRGARIPHLMGMFRQFASFNLNAFKPKGSQTTSRPTYGAVKVRQRWRKRRLLRRFRERYFREKGYVFNVEELATIFHPPAQYTRSPSLERAQARRGEAPRNVPRTPTS